MNDIRRTILWVIFGFSLVLLWDKWQVHNGRQATFFPGPPTATATAPTTTASQPPGATSASATASPAGSTPAAATAAALAIPRERVTLSSDVLRLSFDSEGGSLIHGELLKYTGAQDKSAPFVLLEDTPKHIYVAQTGLFGGDFPTHNTPMRVVPGARELGESDNEVQLRFESPEVGGVKLIKTWTLKRGSYDVGVRHEVVNTGTSSVSPQLYLQLVRDGSKPDGTDNTFYSTFTGPAVYTEAKKYQKV